MQVALSRAHSLLRRARAQWKHAFSMDAPPLDDAEVALLERVAIAVERRKMSTPAVLFLESVKPLSFVGSQALQFIKPLATTVLTPTQFEQFMRILERRDGVEQLINRIEARIP